MKASHNHRAGGPLRHIGRNGIAYLALFLALGGTAFAAGGKLLTGADIQDDSLTGADIVESSLAKVPGAANADQLGGTAAGAFLKTGSAAGGALEGTYPNPDIATDAVTTAQIKNQTVGLVDLANGAVSAPKLLGGAAATNVWGKDQWAPANATQRGYTHVWSIRVGELDQVRAPAAISYPVPLGPSEPLSTHVIRDNTFGLGDPTPDGCGGSISEPMAAPGHVCIFYRPVYDGSKVVDITPGVAQRYGLLLRVDPADFGCDCPAVADVVWAMTPPVG